MNDWIDITKEKPIDGRKCSFHTSNSPKIIFKGFWSQEHNTFIGPLFKMFGPFPNITHWKYLNE